MLCCSSSFIRLRARLDRSDEDDENELRTKNTHDESETHETTSQAAPVDGRKEGEILSSLAPVSLQLLEECDDVGDRDLAVPVDVVVLGVLGDGGVVDVLEEGDDVVGAGAAVTVDVPVESIAVQVPGW